MISNILAGIREPRSPRRYIGKHRARESGRVPRPRTALEADPAARAPLEASAAADVTMELTRVVLPVRPATPPPG